MCHETNPNRGCGTRWFPRNGPAADEHTETKLPPAPERVQVLGFDFEFSLSVEDLKQLSPEQITPLFKAVGEVMAIKATLTE